WQPVIVDYRKKRTSENIARIQQRVGADKSSGGSRASAEAETPLPTRDDERPPAGGMPSATAAPSGAAASADNDVEAATTQLRNRIQQLQDELKQSRAQLEAAQQEKHELANGLGPAREQLDHVQVEEAELRAQLKQ